MTDVLIRGVKQETLDLVTELARRQGLSRNEYLRREFETTMNAKAAQPRVTRRDLARAAAACQDLSDPEIMAAAWR